MNSIHPYLIFNGDCEKAFLFYQSVFGGEFPYMGKFKDMPPSDDPNCPPATGEDAERVMHVSLPIGPHTILMGSDSTSQSGDVQFGNNFLSSASTFRASSNWFKTMYAMAPFTQVLLSSARSFFACGYSSIAVFA